MIKIMDKGSVGLVPEDYLGPPPRKGLSEDEKELQRAKANAAKAQARGAGATRPRAHSVFALCCSSLLRARAASV